MRLPQTFDLLCDSSRAVLLQWRSRGLSPGLHFALRALGGHAEEARGSSRRAPRAHGSCPQRAAPVSGPPRQPGALALPPHPAKPGGQRGPGRWKPSPLPVSPSEAVPPGSAALKTECTEDRCPSPKPRDTPGCSPSLLVWVLQEPRASSCGKATPPCG